MEPTVVQIEQIAREVIARSARAGRNGGGASDIGRLVEEVLTQIELEKRHGGHAVAGAEPGRKLAGDHEQALSARRCPGGGEPPGHRQGTPEGVGSQRSGVREVAAIEITSRVVTLAELEGKLDRAEQVIVPRRAVITPAAHDELKRRGIAVGYAIAPRATTKPRNSVAWGQAETNYDAARLIDALARTGMTIEQTAQTGLLQVIHELSDEITKGGQPAVLLTGQAAVAVCLANRRRGVRAVLAQSVATTMQAVRAVGANLLIVDPAEHNWFELKRLVGQFIAGAPYLCPAEYREQLG